MLFMSNLHVRTLYVIHRGALVYHVVRLLPFVVLSTSSAPPPVPYLFIHQNINDGVDDCTALGQQWRHHAGNRTDDVGGAEGCHHGYDAVRCPAEQVAGGCSQHHEQDVVFPLSRWRLSDPAHLSMRVGVVYFVGRNNRKHATTAWVLSAVASLPEGQATFLVSVCTLMCYLDGKLWCFSQDYGFRTQSKNMLLCTVG